MTSLPERLSQIKERLEYATKGPWVKRPLEMFEGGSDGYEVVDGLNLTVFNDQTYYPRAPHAVDAEFIAHARQDIPDLVAALEVAIEALKYVRRVTYGTEICNSDAENNEILAGHYFNSANNARDALAKIEKLMESK